MEKKTVRLIAVDSKYNVAPYFIAPKFNEKTKQYDTGQSFKNDEEKAACPYVIDEETSIPVKHLQTFDLNNPIDAIVFKFIMLDLALADNKKSVNPLVHRFYVEDKEEEAKITISKTREKIEAFNFIKSMSLEEMMDFARLMQVWARSLSATQIEGKLYDLADEDPEKIISAYTDRNRKHKQFLHKLVDRAVLHMENGKFMYGNELIGINEDYSIEWMKDPKNNSLITSWVKQIKELDNPAPAGTANDATIESSTEAPQETSVPAAEPEEEVVKEKTEEQGTPAEAE